MEQKTKEKLKKLKRLSVLCIWLVIIIAIFQAIPLYQYTKEHPNTQYEAEIVYSLDSQPGDPVQYAWPEEYLTKVRLSNRLRGTIIAGVMLFFAYFMLDYLYDPEKHWITELKKKWNKLHN